MVPIPRILIAEDDKIIANLLSLLLEKRNTSCRKDRTWRGIDHQGGRTGTRSVPNGNQPCPCHGWRYNSPVYVPSFLGAGECTPGASLKTFTGRAI
jgi:hypothetical protein